MAITANPLRYFKTYNYSWSFGVLTAAQLHDPNSYRGNGGTLKLIQMGGFPNKQVKTFVEDQAGINLEYYMDDVSVETIALPNPGSGVSPVTQIEFKVTEPYSVGQFFQSLYIGAQKAGFLDHTSAVYVLSVDFKGLDANGTPQTVEKRTLAIKITDLNFSVTGAGCVYNITAIPYNHIAFLDSIQNTPVTQELQGETVEIMLSSGAQSLQSNLNEQQRRLVNTQQRVTPDEYLISFPVDVAGGGSTNFGGITAPTNRTFNLGDLGIGGLTINGNSRVTINTSTFNASFQNPSSNQFGNSPIIIDITSDGQNPMAAEADTFDNTNLIFPRATVHPDPVTRTFTFSSGTKIEEIINQTLLSSEWGRTLSSRSPDANGYIDWYKIVSDIEILDTNEAAIIGRPAYRFTYNVVPFKVHSNAFQPANTPSDYTPQVQNAVKAYNYVYTGKNEDILDFDFQINNSFFKPFLNPHGAQNTHQSGIVQTAIGQQFFRSNPDVYPDAILRNQVFGGQPTQSRNPFTLDFGTAGGGAINTDARLVAETFNNIVLNSSEDNVELRLKIWGDPYWFTDIDAGNYRASPGAPNITADRQMDHQRQEIDVLVSFNSGIDYTPSGLMAIDPASSFSGLYEVVTVSHTFSGGQFTQELLLIRRPNQPTTTVAAATSLATAFANTVNPTLVSNSVSENAVSIPFVQMINEVEGILQHSPLANISIANFPDIDANAINAAISQAQNLINIGSQIQNNLQSALGGLNIGGINVGQIANTIGQVSTAVNNLQGVANNFVSLTSNVQGIVNIGTNLLASNNFAGLARNAEAALRNITNPIAGIFGTSPTPPVVPRSSTPAPRPAPTEVSVRTIDPNISGGIS